MVCISRRAIGIKAPPQIGKKAPPLKSALVFKKQLKYIEIPLALLINKKINA